MPEGVQGNEIFLLFLKNNFWKLVGVNFLMRT